MKFFTRDLLIRFNSLDDDVADRADEDAEDALHAYRRHLHGLPESVRQRTEKLAKLCLHDAELLAIREEKDWLPLPWSRLVILDLKQSEAIYSLAYVVSGPIAKHEAGDDWPFSRLHVQWLYNELDVSPENPSSIIHRVLLSDGTILEIPFEYVLVHIVDLNERNGADSLRQIA